MTEDKCWMCDPNKYRILDENFPIPRVVDEKKDEYYVIVPRTYLTEGHLLIVLNKQGKKHIEGLEGAVESYDFEKLNEPIRKWTNILKVIYNKDDKLKRVFLTCLCDSEDTKGHFHYHLIPVKKKEKTFDGKGHTWLGVREISTHFLMKPFEECDYVEKKKRADEIKSIVNKLKDARDTVS